MTNSNIFSPMEKEIDSRATRATLGISLMDKIKVARKKEELGLMTEGLLAGQSSNPLSDVDKYQAAIDQAVAEMNRLEISPNVSYALRRRADEFEEEIHRAVLACDDRAFHHALEGWKKCFTEDGKNENGYQQQSLFI